MERDSGGLEGPDLDVGGRGGGAATSGGGFQEHCAASRARLTAFPGQPGSEDGGPKTPLPQEAPWGLLLSQITS